MKKAKLILTAIAILAVVGGALASKARNLHFVYTQSSGTVCDVLRTGAAITTTGVEKIPATIDSTLPCEQNFVTDVPNI